MGSNNVRSRYDLLPQKYVELLRRRKEEFIEKASPVRTFSLSVLSSDVASEINWRNFTERYLEDHEDTCFWCTPLLKFFRHAEFQSEKRWIDQVFCFRFASHIATAIGSSLIQEEEKTVNASILESRAEPNGTSMLSREKKSEEDIEIDRLCANISKAINDVTNPFNLIINEFKRLIVEHFGYSPSKEGSPRKSISRAPPNVDIESEIQQFLVNIQYFVSCLIYSISIFYKSVIDSSKLFSLREVIVNYLIDIIISGKVYDILYDMVRKKSEANMKLLHSKITENKHITPRRLGINSYLSLRKEDKEEIAKGFGKKKLEAEVLFSFFDAKTNTFEPYDKAIKKIKEIVDFRTPMAKLRTIEGLNKIICICIDNFWRDIDIPPEYLNIDADQYLSILLYVIIKAGLTEIYANVVLANYLVSLGFRTDYNKYCLTTLMAAFSYILSDEFTNIMNKASEVQNGTKETL
eukprot:TRINITY_DN15145_c0_g2_i1.p1 TRINITY_DN15145_c0_g2~~TRINITY_DN15145_c0_g2_i1.p1  ORF type:complete len:465 (+),score=126.74 TRINITY_DN15145_c0_g2_i1:1259-2653(+)